jgi:hypothetical protein
MINSKAESHSANLRKYRDNSIVSVKNTLFDHNNQIESDLQTFIGQREFHNITIETYQSAFTGTLIKNNFYFNLQIF